MSRIRSWFDSPRVAAVVLAIAAMVFLVLGVGTLVDDLALREHGVRAEAEVLRVHEDSGNRSDSSYVELRFTPTGGEAVRAHVEDYRWHPTPRVGDRAVVVYDPDDPAGKVVDARLGPDITDDWLLIGFGLAGALLVRPTWRGAVPWGRRRR